MAFFDFIDDRVVFLPARFVDPIVRVLSRNRSIRRDNRHIQLVDVMELVCFGLSRAGHTGELLIKPEIILDRDRSLRSRRFVQATQSLFHRQPLPVRTVGRHRVVRVADEDDARFDRDIVAAQAVGIAGSVVALVAVPHDRSHLLEPVDRGDDLLAQLGMRLDYLALLISERAIEIDLSKLADQIR